MMFFLDDISYCDSLSSIISILQAIVGLFQFGIPILLIIFGMLDLGKAVIASKEEEMKKTQGMLIRRFIYAVAVFLVVTLVTLVMNIVGDAQIKENPDTDTWLTCWKNNGNIRGTTILPKPSQQQDIEDLQ